MMIAFVLLAQFTNAQETRNLGDFDAVKVFDKINVKLISASENKIEINGNRAAEVETVNKNGELKIRMPFPKLLSGDAITVKLYFKRIESIDAGEGSYVSADKTFQQTTMSLNAKEGAEISVDVDVDKVKVRAVSGGIIEIAGKAVKPRCCDYIRRNFESKRITHLTNCNKRCCGRKSRNSCYNIGRCKSKSRRFYFYLWKAKTN